VANLKAIFLTGVPGVGKTTVLLKTVEELRKSGLSVGGMASGEVRERGLRVGFKIVDLATGREGWLAHVRQLAGPSVGKYRVSLDDLKLVGANAIRNAVRQADVTVVDEVGPMELFSHAFREAVMEALDSGKAVLGTVHHRAQDPFVVAIRRRTDTSLVEVTPSNRDRLPQIIAQGILDSLGKG